jgi:Tol biopolymer transport system component
MTRMTGTPLAHYEILEQIGAGGMGEVYRARDTHLDRDVAIKILPEIFSQDPERLARFEREAKLLASLNHAGIAVVHGLHEEDGLRFLAMELVPGEDLDQRLKRGGLSLEDSLLYAEQIAEALEAAHEQGVVHRDLKPSNIVVKPDGRTKVLDFGLAKSMEGGAAPSDISQSPTLAAVGTMQGVILGTAAYMSPEQARGRPVDKRSDIWSFGVILYEMLVGRQLFSGETVSDTMAGVLKTVVDFDPLPATTPQAVIRLLERCLDRSPATRLRDVGEARILLHRVNAGEIAPGAAAPEPARRSLTRYGGWIAAAAAVLAAAAILVLRPAPTSTAEVPLRKFTIPMSVHDPSAKDQFHPRISPDGRSVVYASQGHLWIRDLSAVDPRPLAGTEGAANPFWSPDGKWIAFGIEQDVRKVPREGGTPVHVVRMRTSQSLTTAGAGGCWMEDGRLVMGTGLTGLLTVPAQGGDITTLVSTAEGETDFHTVAALPGDRGIVFVVHGPHGYGILDIATPDGTRRRILETDDNINDPSYSPTGHIVFRREGNSPGVWAVPFSLDRLERTGEPFPVAAGGIHPSVAGDGTLFYVTGSSTSRAQLLWVDRAGAVVGEIGPAEEVFRPFPEISDDGKSILHCAQFGEGREVYRYDVATGNRQRLTFNDLREDMADYLPNGRDIFFYESNEFHTYGQGADGQVQDLFRGIMARFTRDGTRVVFSRNKPETFEWDVLLRDVDGGEKTEKFLVATPGLDWWPRLSPDERYLAYTSDETGHTEVYLTTFPDAATRWQVSTDGGEFPHWRADGREIFYTTREAILSVDISTESGLVLGAPHVLFQRPLINWNPQWSDGFDVTADGQRFALFGPIVDETTEQPALVVVQNWFAEFAGAATGGR